MFQNGFFAAVDDYPIAGGWGLNGKLFTVGDASGSVQAFDGTSGRKIWEIPKLTSVGSWVCQSPPMGNSSRASGKMGNSHFGTLQMGNCNNELKLRAVGSSMWPGQKVATTLRYPQKSSHYSVIIW